MGGGGRACGIRSRIGGRTVCLRSVDSLTSIELVHRRQGLIIERADDMLRLYGLDVKTALGASSTRGIKLAIGTCLGFHFSALGHDHTALLWNYSETVFDWPLTMYTHHWLCR